MIAVGQPFEEIWRQMADAGFRFTRESPELFLALGLGALAPVEVVRAAQADADARYLASLDHLLTNPAPLCAQTATAGPKNR